MKNRNSVSAAPPAPPPLKIASEHHARLRSAALHALDVSPLVAQRLLDEIDRAELCALDRLPADVVEIGSRVRYRDQRTGRETLIVLVWPGEADLAARKVSVLSPIGAALIGLSVGQRIEWSVEDGQVHVLEVTEVSRDAAPAR